MKNLSLVSFFSFFPSFSLPVSYVPIPSQFHLEQVWRAADLGLVATLRGHELAVTAVAWQTLADGACVLATCSDDRTVRIYDGAEAHGGTGLALLRVLTSPAFGWHTLT
jgi:WD40 repeat protein